MSGASSESYEPTTGSGSLDVVTLLAAHPRRGPLAWRTRRCTRCRMTKPVVDFHRNLRRCRACNAPARHGA
jgi:hypothetical protein